MAQTQKDNNSHPDIQPIGVKLEALWNQPLLTIQFTNPSLVKPPMEKKPVPTKVAMRQPNRPIPVSRSNKSVMHGNTPTGRKTVQYIFTPMQNKAEFEKILFVLRACEKTGSERMFTSVLHVEHIWNGSRLVATDGKRLHVTDITTRIIPGNYKPVVKKDQITLGKSDFYGDYPNWERVVPANVTRRGCINFGNATAWETSRVNITFTKMSGEKVNPNYLADLTKKAWVIYCSNEKRKAVLLKEYGSKETYAVIMPLSA